MKVWMLDMNAWDGFDDFPRAAVVYLPNGDDWPVPAEDVDAMVDIFKSIDPTDYDAWICDLCVWESSEDGRPDARVFLATRDMGDGYPLSRGCAADLAQACRAAERSMGEGPP